MGDYAKDPVAGTTDAIDERWNEEGDTVRPKYNKE